MRSVTTPCYSSLLLLLLLLLLPYIYLSERERGEKIIGKGVRQRRVGRDENAGQVVRGFEGSEANLEGMV